MGLTLNEAKTSIKQARQESFNFLGYTFGPHRYKKDGRLVFGSESVEEERWHASRKRWENFWCPATRGPGRRCGIG